jgi:hypothetical protein
MSQGAVLAMRWAIFCDSNKRQKRLIMQFTSKYYIVILWALLFMSMTARVWQNPRGVIWSDAEGYYVYNPTLFIVGDLHAMPSESVTHEKNDRGENVNKYTCGVALLQMPFFLAARAFCKISGQAPDQVFSIHYARAIAVAGYTFGFLGLFFLDRALRRQFSPMVSALTTLAVFSGTNLHYYMTHAMGMSHAYSFFLFAFIVWQVPRFYARPSTKNALLLGACLGCIVLIRPTNILVIWFVGAYQLMRKETIATRVNWWLQHYKQVLLIALSSVLLLLPQFVYWYTMTGKFVRYSYVGEEFKYWASPKILDVLFDVQNGLFLYSPMVLLMVIGLGTGYRDRRAQSISGIPIFIAATYLFASWWAWWFGGAFGHRCYVEYYALLALPLAVMIERVLASKHRVIQYSFFAILAFLAYYGVKMSYLYTTLPKPWDGPDWRWNWAKILEIWRHLW